MPAFYYVYIIHTLIHLMTHTHTHTHTHPIKTLFLGLLVAQWLRIHLPIQGTRVRALAREDPTCRGAAKPVHHNYRACALEPASHNY